MILVDVVFLHSSVTYGCWLSSEMSMTVTSPGNTESFSTRAFQATASIPNAEFTNFASKHCSEWWHNDRAPGAPCQSFAANTVSLSYFSICTRVFTSNLIANYCSA